MRLATGDNDVAVCWVKVCSEHWLIRALKHKTLVQLSTSWKLFLYFFHSINFIGMFFLEPENLRHTLTSAIRSSLCQSQTESVWSLESSTTHSQFPPFSHRGKSYSNQLKQCQKWQTLSQKSPQDFSYRLGERQTDQTSVKEAWTQNMEGVEADGVPNTNMRSKML